MKKFAVSYINWFDNILKTKIVEAEDWKSALAATEFYGSDEDFIFTLDTMEAAKQEAFNMDSMFEVVEVV